MRLYAKVNPMGDYSKIRFKLSMTDVSME